MTLTQLEYLIAVDTHRHFGRAAEACFVTQPTLSMQLKKLEEELEVVLFDRGKQPVVPTPIAELILEDARQMVQLGQRIRDVITDDGKIVAGLLRLGIIPTVAPYLLPLVLKHFSEHYPQVRLEVEELTTEQIIRRLKTDELDVGIAATPLPEGGLTEKPLYYEPFVAYASDQSQLLKKNAISSSDIDLHELWLLAEGHCFRNQVINLCHEQALSVKNFQINLKAGSIETLKGLVENNEGVTLLPELATLDFNASRRKHLRYFKSPEPVREVSLITRRLVIKKRLMTALEESVLANVPAKYVKKENREIINIRN